MAEKETVKNNTTRYKTENCKVLLYDPKNKVLDILFKGYGIRINNAENPQSEYIKVKYRGEIGCSNFVCKL